MSVASYSASASVRPRCSGGVSREESGAVSKNRGEISWRSSKVKVMASVSFSADEDNPGLRVAVWGTQSQRRKKEESRSTYLDEIEDPKGDERSMQLLYLLVVESKGTNDESS